MQLSALRKRRTTPYLTRNLCPGLKYISSFYWLIIKLTFITRLLGLVQVTKLCPLLLSLDHVIVSIKDYYIVHIDCVVA